MPLTLSDVYNMRNGIISFTSNLRENMKHGTFEDNSGPINSYFDTINISVNPPIQKKDGEKDAVYKQRLRPYAKQMMQRKQGFINGVKDVINEHRNEACVHRVAIEAYLLFDEKAKELEEANKNNPDNAIVKEFRKNVDLFHYQLLKMGIEEFEIRNAVEKNPEVQNKTEQMILFESFNEKMAAVGDKYNVDAMFKRNGIEDTAKAAVHKAMDTECLKRVPAAEINENNNLFYGIFKNAYLYARDYNTDYYDMPLDLPAAPGGYKYAEDGKLVAKESTGFFNAIGNFFRRLANHGAVDAYNAKVDSALATFDNAEAVKEIDKMEKVTVERTRILVEELEKETGMSKDLKESMATSAAMDRVDYKEEEVKVGPGLGDLD